MKRPKELTAAMKSADSQLVAYILQMEKQNLQLHDKIAKFQAKDVSQQHEIAALKKFQPRQRIELEIEGLRDRSHDSDTSKDKE